MSSRALLAVTLLVSLLLHGLMLWISPHWLRSVHQQQEAPLEVTLLAAPLPAVREEPAHPVQPAAKKPTHKTHPNHERDLAAQTKPSTHAAPAPSTRNLDELRASTLLEAHRAGAEPTAGRTRIIAAHDRNLIFAAYEEAYRRKVENVGSVNYPPPVNGMPLSGAVRMRALVGADGHLIEVSVEGSSGVAELDRAARQIVHMAAPFQAFTEPMKTEADQVAIICTFRFTSLSRGVSSQP